MGTAHGAISILNALATGKGAALSIELATKARVTLSEGKGPIRLCSEQAGSNEYGKLAEIVARRTLEKYGHETEFHGEVETSSSIPSRSGLKSSSAAANAIALATIAAIGEEPHDNELIKIGIEASIESGVSLTGGFDDSYASYYGGAVLADNNKRSVEIVPTISKDLRIIILVPGVRNSQVPLDPSYFSSIRIISQVAYREATNGKLWDALTLNGLAFTSILGQNPGPALASIAAGALGAGLSGKGPAIAAVTTDEKATQVRSSLERFDGQIIETRPNFEKASIKI